MDRRKFLFTTAAAGVVVLPGCGAETVAADAATPNGSPPTPTPLPPSPTPTPTTTPVPTPNPTPTPAPVLPQAPPPAPGVPPPPPQPAWPPSRPAEVRVSLYEANVGTAHPATPEPMYWQSAQLTKDGTLIEWGAGDHQVTSDNGVREFDPLTGTQSYVYPNNRGTVDQQQYDNLSYFSIPRLDVLVLSGTQAYHRGSGKWLVGNLINTGRKVIGSGANDLFNPIVPFWIDGFTSSYNAHQAWSAQHDCGILISSGLGGDSKARQTLWIIAPSRGFGSYPQPYVIYERTMPSTVGGVAAHKVSGRDGCCFAGDYVYWVGGWENNSNTPTPHFFRMKITPHLTATNATLAIERLPDAPAAFHMGLLRYDPNANALLCISSTGIFVFDIVTWSWANVTPAAYRSEFAGAPTNGLLPNGCMGDYIESRNGQAIRKVIWRPGWNGAWEYDYGGNNSEKMYKRFRAITLARG